MQNPQLTDLEGKQSPSGTDTQIARHQLEQNQVKQNQVDYWQNLFRTLSHSPVEVSDPQAIQTQQSTESTPAPLAWLLSSLNTGLQNLSQLTNPLQPFLNQQNLSFATDIRSLSGQSDHALKHSLVLQELQTQSPILTTDSANLSLETQDFTQQQETNGFWPRATELSFATQTPRSEASAELAQTNTSAALHELGERFALVKQLSQRVQLLNQRDRSIELALEPAHLGKLTLRLQQSAQQLNLQIFTELALTKDLIESHLQQLRNQLQAQGFDVQQIQVQLQPDNQFSQNSSSGQQQESRQGPASNAFDLFQSEEMEPETNSEPLQTHVDIKFNHQINTLV